MDDLVNPKLSFDAAINVVQGNITNKAKEDHLRKDAQLNRDKELVSGAGIPIGKIAC